MRKKALHKDIRQEIKRTFPRFLSLFLMSALGVSFFSGVRASMPDMLSTTDRYLDGTDLFDLQAVSTMGLQEEDLEAVLDTEGVEEAELSYSSDLLCDSEGEQYVVHLMAKSGMAQCQVEEGRMPEKADDIFLDTRLAQSPGGVRSEIRSLSMRKTRKETHRKGWPMEPLKSPASAPVLCIFP